MDRRPAPRTFFPFGRLPYELRDTIWEISLPRRLVNHNRPIPLGRPTLSAYMKASDARAPWPSPSPWAPDGVPVALARGDHAIPSTAHVCRHAREVVLRNGAWMRSPGDPTAPPAWFDFGRDTVLIEDANAMDLLFPPLPAPAGEDAADAAAAGAHATAAAVDIPAPVDIPAVAAAAAGADTIAGAGTDRRHLLANLDRVAGGDLAIAYTLLRDAPYRYRLARMLADRPGTVCPLLVYSDEIVLHGSRAAVAAAALDGLFHGPVISRGAGAATSAGRRFRCWRLVRLQDTATLQRMVAFSEALVPPGHRTRREDPAVAFFRNLLRPQHSQKSVRRIRDICRFEMALAGDRPPPPGMAELLQFHPAVLVWFMVDENQA